MTSGEISGKHTLETPGVLTVMNTVPYSHNSTQIVINSAAKKRGSL